jgi:hypothetical protein
LTTELGQSQTTMDKTHRSDTHRDRRQQFPLVRTQPSDRGKNYDETISQPATIKVYYDREHASYIEVSVAPEK